MPTVGTPTSFDTRRRLTDRLTELRGTSDVPVTTPAAPTKPRGRTRADLGSYYGSHGDSSRRPGGTRRGRLSTEPSTRRRLGPRRPCLSDHRAHGRSVRNDHGGVGAPPGHPHSIGRTLGGEPPLDGGIRLSQPLPGATFPPLRPHRWSTTANRLRWADCHSPTRLRHHHSMERGWQLGARAETLGTSELSCLVTIEGRHPGTPTKSPETLEQEAPRLGPRDAVA
jgi:hypothetical protein